MLKLRLLGQFDVCLDETPIVLSSRNAQSLLAYLALTAGTPHRRERLAALLWPDTDEDNSRSYLRHALWRIRKAIESGLPDGSQYLLADELTIALNPRSAYWLDVAAIEQAASNAATGTEQLLVALALYRGELLPGFQDEWAVRERERLAAVFERLMDRVLDRLVDERRWPDVLEVGERWISLGHAPEPAFRALMVAHSERGDRARVADVYRRCREALFEELGAMPSDQTRVLYERLARGERVLPTTPQGSVRLRDDTDGESPASGESPFQGLHYFDEDDADRFFGRERLVASLVERLQTARFLALIGASGSGKSSVVRAGLVPTLRATGLTDSSSASIVHLLTPTAHPLEALATSLTAPNATQAETTELVHALARDPRSLRLHLRRTLPRGRRAVVVVDQFEELFTLCRDQFEREAFGDNLLAVSAEADAPASVVIALRADFYAHCAQHADLRERLAHHQEYLGTMTAEELRRAIEEPARRSDWSFEAGLVDLVLQEVGEEPGALPLLSHALLETWQHRRGRRMTLRGYAETGGVRGAIARTAEAVFHERLTTEQQPLARRIFIRLTELGEGTQDTRRRALLEELISGPDDAAAVREVLDILAASRLVTLTETTAEVAHEVLIREWPTLRGWLDEDRTGLRMHRRIAEAAGEWIHRQHDPDLLYRGARLAQSAEWAEVHAADLSPDEREFLAAAVDRAEQETSEREAQRQRELDAVLQLADAEQRRANEQFQAAARLRRRALSLAGALVLALGMGGAAVFFGDQAHRGALTEQANARTALARELAAAATSSLDTDPERSIWLALRSASVTYAVDGTWTTDAENALHRAVLASRARLTLAGHTGVVSALAFSSDGSHLATAGEDGAIKVWDATSGRELWTRSGQAGVPNGAAFSPDGSRIAATGVGGTVRVCDTLTGQQLLTLVGHTGPVTRVAFSWDGRRLASTAADGMVKLWDANTGEDLRTVYGSDIRDVAFSPNDGRLVTVEHSGTISIWDGNNLSVTLPVLTLQVAGEGLSAAFSPNGRRIAAVDGYDVRIWDADTGRELQRLIASANKLTRVAFSPDGTRLAIGGVDHQVTIWDAGSGRQLVDIAKYVASGRQLLTLAGHEAGITEVVFAGDGNLLASAAEDGTAKVWNVGVAYELFALPVPESQRPFTAGSSPVWLGRVSYDAAGQRLGMGLLDGTAEVWDARTGHELLTVGGSHSADEWSILGLTFSPDGTSLATGGADGIIKFWDATSGSELRTTPGHEDRIFSVAYSPDGTHLASGSADGSTRVWNLQAFDQPPLVLPRHANAVSSVAYSPDGRRLATASVDGSARILDASTGAQLLSVGSAGLSARIDSRSVGGGSSSTGPFRSVAELAAEPDALFSVAFSPDGTRLISAGRAGGGTASIWNAESGLELRVLRGHTDTVVQAIFSPDGRRVATASRDGTAKVWDASSGRNLLTLYGDGAGLGGVAFSADGTRLAVGSDRSARIYLLQMEDLVALAQERLTRSRTIDECQRFLHVDVCPE